MKRTISRMLKKLSCNIKAILVLVAGLLIGYWLLPHDYYVTALFFMSAIFAAALSRISFIYNRDYSGYGFILLVFVFIRYAMLRATQERVGIFTHMTDAQLAVYREFLLSNQQAFIFSTFILVAFLLMYIQYYNLVKDGRT